MFPITAPLRRRRRRRRPRPPPRDQAAAAAPAPRALTYAALWALAVGGSAALSFGRSAALVVYYGAPSRCTPTCRRSSPRAAAAAAPARTRTAAAAADGARLRGRVVPLPVALLPARRRRARLCPRRRRQLPAPYVAPPPAGARADGHFNDQNREEPGRYVPVKSCDWLVELRPHRRRDAVAQDQGVARRRPSPLSRRGAHPAWARALLCRGSRRSTRPTPVCGAGAAEVSVEEWGALSTNRNSIYCTATSVRADRHAEAQAAVFAFVGGAVPAERGGGRRVRIARPNCAAGAAELRRKLRSRIASPRNRGQSGRGGAPRQPDVLDRVAERAAAAVAFGDRPVHDDGRDAVDRLGGRGHARRVEHAHLEERLLALHRRRPLCRRGTGATGAARAAAFTAGHRGQ